MSPIVVALLLTPGGEDLQERTWSFESRLSVWAAYEGNTRVHTLEEEAIPKGGTGLGSRLQWEDVEIDGVSWVPEIELIARNGPNRLFAGFLHSRREEPVVLERNLELDGDLLFAGDAGTSSSEMSIVHAGWTHRVVDSGSFTLDAGLEAAWYGWDFEIRRRSGNIINNDYSSTISWRGLYLPAPSVLLDWKVADGFSLEAEVTALYAVALQSGRGVTDNTDAWMRLAAGVRWDFGAWSARLDLMYLLIDASAFEHRDEADLLNYRLFGVRAGIGLRF